MARGGFLPLSRHSFVPVTRKNSPEKEFVKIQKFFLTNLRSAAIIIHACSSRAGIAQLVEQLICNQQVGGSSPSTSSIPGLRQIEYGGIPEWPKGTDCKSAGNAFGGSNPPSPTIIGRQV